MRTPVHTHAAAARILFAVAIIGFSARGVWADGAVALGTDVTIDCGSDDVELMATAGTCQRQYFFMPFIENATDPLTISCSAVGPDGQDVPLTGPDVQGVVSGVFPADCVNPSVVTCEIVEDSNAEPCSFTVTVTESTAPMLVCPPNILLDCSSETDPNAAGFPLVEDNCDPVPVIMHTDIVTGTFPNLSIKRTWSVTDNCGNTASCMQTITVADNMPPALECPADMMVDCNGSTDPNDTGRPDVEDNCDLDPVVSYSDQSVGTFPDIVITRTWMAVDASGNDITCDQIITVFDDTSPNLNCPMDVTVECDTLVDPGTPPSPDTTGTATATDNCDDEPTVTYEDEISGDFPKLTITRMWRATDDANNAALCPQIITVTDTTDPEITCPNNITIECDQLGGPGNLPPPGLTGVALASDNCDPQPAIDYVDEVDGEFPKMVITRTWTATDECDNSDTCTQIITVTDTTPPTIDCPPDIRLECNGQVDVNDMIGVGSTGEPTTGDNCDPSPGYFFSDEREGEFPTILIRRTFNAIDECENVSEPCVQIITISDTTPPVITCEATGAAIGEDGTATITFAATVVDNCCVDAADVTTSAVETIFPEDAFTFSVEAADCSGNAATPCADTGAVSPSGKITFAESACNVTQVDPFTVTVECSVLAFTDCDENGTPDAEEADTDGDGVINVCDNCPQDFNPGQGDSNGNGIGDACDSVPQTLPADDVNDVDLDEGQADCGAGLCGAGALGALPLTLFGLALMRGRGISRRRSIR